MATKQDKTPEERAAMTEKARQARAAKRKAAAYVPTQPDLTPKDAVDMLYEDRDNNVVKTDLSTPEPKPRRRASVNRAARNSRDAAVAAANPDNVAKIREMLGEFFNLEDVAAALGITTRTVLQKLRDGELEGRKMGGQWRISINALKRFMGVLPIHDDNPNP
jgi:excisionase family DNA binding protein